MPPSPLTTPVHPRRKRRRRPSFLLGIAFLAVVMAAFVVYEQQRHGHQSEADFHRLQEQATRFPGSDAADPSSSLGASLGSGSRSGGGGENPSEEKSTLSTKGKAELFDVNAPPNPRNDQGDSGVGGGLFGNGKSVWNSTFALWGHQDNRLHVNGADNGDDSESTKEVKKKRNKKLRPFPVVDDTDDSLPLTSNTGFVAADALLCPKNVIDYVINATDSKDECVMLTKAFEKHCTTENGPSSNLHSRRRLDTTEREYDARYDTSYRSDRTSSKRRRGPNPILKWQLYLKSMVRTFHLTSWFGRSTFDKLSSRRSLAGEDQKLDVVEKPPALDIDQAEKEEAAPTPTSKSIAQNRTYPEKEKPKVSLALPTTSHHMSNKAITESLLLQSEDVLTAKAMSGIENQTDPNAHDEAAAAAKASSKAVSDAAELIQSILNDPTSVEARACCGSILSVFHDNCEEDELSDSWLFIVVLVLALCGVVKSLIRHNQIRCLPEAAGCILVGLVSGWVLSYFPHHDISFDGDWFLRIMVPPIVFEAALGINKHSFKRHIVPILVYAFIGTLFATGLTAFIVHEGTKMLRGYCETIPYIESLAFGALISSIDPIAVLSVLSNMGMTDTDTIYVLIFGESLLNDGVAIVLFQTLVHFLDENIVMDQEAMVAATFHFLVVAFGSLFVGAASGLLCTIYFWAMHKCQTPLVEVLMFFCWALIPYYICDGIEWSGIVAVVAAGFVMDLGVVGERGLDRTSVLDLDLTELSPRNGTTRTRKRRPLFLREGHMSDESRTHIGFVTEIVATAMETAIFAYLGLFLFSSRYHWNVYHVTIAILGCCLSRAIMIPCLTFLANSITKAQALRDSCRNRQIVQLSTGDEQKSTGNGGGSVIVDKKMQVVLWFAGLRGAMSFALVEDIPMYDTVSGEGSRLKSELKAMTSASILFTIFILGGSTYSLMESLGLAPNQANSSSPKHQQQQPQQQCDTEMVSLLANGSRSEDDKELSDGDDQLTTSSNNSTNTRVRQRALVQQKTY